MREVFGGLNPDEPTIETEPEEKEYQFFKVEQERLEIFEYCKAVAEYLRDQNIPNLVLVDNSARLMYIGIREYFKSKYPGEDVPNIYFVNPQGFRSTKSASFNDIQRISFKARDLGDTDESIEKIRREDDVRGEFEQTYQKLLQDKDQPVLIFDTCIHSGGTLSPIKKIFEESGFSNIKIGAINPADEKSSIKADYYITETEPFGECRPFERDFAVEKTYTRSSSKLTRNPRRRDLGIELREEISGIIKDYSQIENQK